MNYEMIKDLIVFEGITGSIAYGTELRDKDGNLLSDVDIRGLFIIPSNERMTLFPLSEEVSKENEDTKYFELHKFLNLCMKATPNVLELLWLPNDCILKMTDKMQYIIQNRNLFITKQAIITHAGYAFAQIKKARGSNKLINNPFSKEHPNRLDFCWFVPNKSVNFDTIPMKETGIDLDKCRATAIPHLTDCYHIYPNGNGVFKGDMLVFDNVLKEERGFPIGMMTYQKSAYEQNLKKWKEYWDWMKNRNDLRWENNGEKFDYDRKNMLHTLRLMFSAENIIKNREPIVRFQGETLNFLRKIREGVFKYEELMNITHEKMEFIESQKNRCDLPDSSDKKKINKLFKELLK